MRSERRESEIRQSGFRIPKLDRNKGGFGVSVRLGGNVIELMGKSPLPPFSKVGNWKSLFSKEGFKSSAFFVRGKSSAFSVRGREICCTV